MKDERKNSESGCGVFVVKNSVLKKYNGREERVRLPGFIYAVGELAFAGNDTIKTVSLSSNVTVIDDYAFYGCSALEEVILPYEITAIGEQAFKGCTSLLQIVFNGNKERWLSIKKGEGWFEGTHDFIIICKDADITKQEEIDIESEPAINFDFEKNITLEETSEISLEGERREYLERRRRELVARMQSEVEDDDSDESEQDEDEGLEARIKFNADNFQTAAREVGNDKNYDDIDDIDDIRYKALKFCFKKGYASISLIQRRFPIGYSKSCDVFNWMIDEGYIRNSGKNTTYRFTISEEKLRSIIKAATQEATKEIQTLEKLLEKLTLNKKDSVRQLAIVLNQIAKKKCSEDIAIEEPSHSLWNDRAEFDAAVMERLERLVRSDLKMARQSAIKKAETYLYAVHDTHDSKMAQVYERVVYELKITSDSLYNQIRNCIRDE